MNDPVVYDKAKFHIEGQFPQELGPENAYTHIGFFFGWLCARRLVSELVTGDFEPELMQFLSRRITAPNLIRLLGGTLASDMLSVDGNGFTDDYYAHHYFADYQEIFGVDVATLYHVKDTWDNLAQIGERLDRRYAEWLEKRK